MSAYSNPLSQGTESHDARPPRRALYCLECKNKKGAGYPHIAVVTRNPYLPGIFCPPKFNDTLHLLTLPKLDVPPQVASADTFTTPMGFTPANSATPPTSAGTNETDDIILTPVAEGSPPNQKPEYLCCSCKFGWQDSIFHPGKMDRSLPPSKRAEAKISRFRDAVSRNPKVADLDSRIHTLFFCTCRLKEDRKLFNTMRPHTVCSGCGIKPPAGCRPESDYYKDMGMIEEDIMRRREWIEEEKRRSQAMEAAATLEQEKKAEEQAMRRLGHRKNQSSLQKVQQWLFKK